MKLFATPSELAAIKEVAAFGTLNIEATRLESRIYEVNVFHKTGDDLSPGYAYIFGQQVEAAWRKAERSKIEQAGMAINQLGR
jgi:hypothetical protein